MRDDALALIQEINGKMQSLVRNAKKFRLKVLESMYRNEIKLNLEKPIVSFTFDDFPKTALTNGAKILEKYDVKGTYYTAFGLIDSMYRIGKAYSKRDVRELIERDHEIGCHTYSHVSLRNYFALQKPHLGLKKYLEDITRNNNAYRQFNSDKNLYHFSYPHGVISLKAKKVSSKYFKTCRSVIEGINAGYIDLNLLKANRLYSTSKPIDEIISLIDKNVYHRGWLIFYTHDISSNHSPWGCTVEYFDEIVKRASETNEVLTIEEAYQKVCSRKAGLS